MVDGEGVSCTVIKCSGCGRSRFYGCRGCISGVGVTFLRRGGVAVVAGVAHVDVVSLVGLFCTGVS